MTLDSLIADGATIPSTEHGRLPKSMSPILTAEVDGDAWHS
jgi:hypothetical protein